jgi:rhamnogalacturonyl hydrolase YesR
MLWCLQTYYEYTTDPRVIELMTNYFKWQLEYPEEKFLKDRWDTIRAGDNLYSVYWLYNITGDEWLLELGKKIQRNTAN